MVLLKFKTRQDKVNGFYLLALKGTVRGLPNGIFEVNDTMLEILRNENIKFEVINNNSLDEATKIRNTPTVIIQ